MSKVILTIGIPASGKTSWAIAEAKNTGAMIVCRDDIRRMLGLDWNEDEDKVTDLSDSLIDGLLNGGYDIIVADTNINRVNRARHLAIFALRGIEAELKFFPIPTNVAVSRDYRRAEKVGASVIQNMQRNYINQFGTVGTL